MKVVSASENKLGKGSNTEDPVTPIIEGCNMDIPDDKTSHSNLPIKSLPEEKGIQRSFLKVAKTFRTVTTVGIQTKKTIY